VHCQVRKRLLLVLVLVVLVVLLAHEGGRQHAAREVLRLLEQLQQPALALL
jgi:hypothetical protein